MVALKKTAMMHTMVVKVGHATLQQSAVSAVHGGEPNWNWMCTDSQYDSKKVRLSIGETVR